MVRKNKLDNFLYYIKTRKTIGILGIIGIFLCILIITILFNNKYNKNEMTSTNKIPVLIDFYDNWSESFGGVKWGTDISKYKEMVYCLKLEVKYGKEVISYFRNNDKLQMGSFYPDCYIYYNFWDNKLYE